MYVISPEDMMKVRMNREGQLKIVPDNAEPTQDYKQSVVVETISDGVTVTEFQKDEAARANKSAESNTGTTPSKTTSELYAPMGRTIKIVAISGAAALLIYLLFVWKKA